MNLSHDFSINQRFLDPKLTNDGKPYGPWKYGQLVDECYFISHQIHTSYSDLMKITPRERMRLLENLIKEAEEARRIKEESKKALEARMEELKSSKKQTFHRK